MIGVTGATGAIGGRVAERLARLGVQQRLLVRDAGRAPQLDGAEVRDFVDYSHATSFADALDGADTLFFVSAAEHVERVRQHITAVDAALAAGVERIVYLSFLGAAEDATFVLARHHWATEEHIRASGVAFTFLRSSLYMDILPFVCGSDGVIRGPAGSGRVAPVARDDVADVVTAVLTSDGHDGACYDNTGPEALTLQDVADELARVSGRSIEYVVESTEEAWESRRPTGAPDWEIEGWITSYLAIAAGEMNVVSDTVPRLTGHPAMSLAQYLAAYPTSYEHLKNPS